jgi:hypothetical protein
MDILNDLLGGNRRQEYENFAERYDHGAPWDDIDDNEAVERYRQVSPNLSEQDYRQSAQEAFSRLTPQQRSEFGRWLQHQAQQRGTPLDFGGDQRYDDPGVLAGASTRLHQQQPGLLDGLLGGAMGNRGAGAPAGSGGDLLSSPIAKAVLAGIAATAVSKVIGRR